MGRRGHHVVAAILVGILVGLPGVAPLFPGAAGGSASGPRPDSGAFEGWRDDFSDTSRVQFSNGVVFNGVDVRLPSPALVREGKVLPLSPIGWDSLAIAPLSVLHNGTAYLLWYSGCTGGPACSIGFATSPDGRTWTKQGIVVSPSLPQEGNLLSYGDVILVGSTYRMWYSAYDGANYRIFAADSPDGASWAKRGVALDIGSPGSFDDRYVFEPTVLEVGGNYRMWYSASSNADPNGWLIMTASSSDGVTWTKEGVVLSVGSPGSLDGVRVWAPVVRSIAGKYEMIYTGMDGTTDRLFFAESLDGIIWTKLGLALDSLPPNETTLGPAVILPEPDGGWLIHYAARGSSGFEVYLARRPPFTGSMGWVRSNPVSIPGEPVWGWFNQTATIPPETWVNVTVRDASSLGPLPGLENLTAGSVPLLSVDPIQYPSLVFDAWLTSMNPSATPILDSWQTVWVDDTPPAFGGLESATDVGTGGNVNLSWSAAGDYSPPITYSVYEAVGTDPFDFLTPSYVTDNTNISLTGLTNGVLYRFVVRASDAWGNQEGNTVSRSVIPTTPVDGVPPFFAGLALAQDAGTGGSVRLTWLAATDPDTPASSVDPSLPISYLVFAAPSAGSFNFTSPYSMTTGLTTTVSGLSDGVEYQFLVRAMDSRGNVENNMVVQRGTPTHPFDTTPPTFAGVFEATDLGRGDRVNVTWNPAVDPDTPESGVDPSVPITYSVWVSRVSTNLGLSPPNTTTEETFAVIAGLQPGVTYYVLVRATDGAGNQENNTLIISFDIREPPREFLSSYWWIIALTAGIVAALAVVLVLWRRRKRDETPPPPVS